MGKIIIPERKNLEQEYRSRCAAHRQTLDRLKREMEELLEGEHLHVTIRSRVKSFESYYEKVLRRLRNPETAPRARMVSDLLGLRVICSFLGDLNAVEKALQTHYQIIEIEYKGENQSFREFGYDSTHLLILVPEHLQNPRNRDTQKVCEVQLRTILQEAWAEIEHELVYKADLSPLDEPLKRKLASLKATLTLSDNIFQEIRDYQQQMQVHLKRRRDSFWLRVMALGQSAVGDHFPGTASRDTKQPQSTKSWRNEEKPLFCGEDTDSLLLEALAAHNDRYLNRAISLYSRILQKDMPGSVRSIIYVHRGMARFINEEFEKALDDFSNALRNEEKNDRALFCRGVALWALGRPKEALVDFTTCLELNPTHLDALLGRAMVRLQLQDLTGARDDSKLALSISPSSSEVQSIATLIESTVSTPKQ